MKRLNEYTPEQLENLILMLSIAGNVDRFSKNGNLKDLDCYKFWAEELRQAKRDAEFEEHDWTQDLSGFEPPLKSNDVVIVIDPLP